MAVEQGFFPYFPPLKPRCVLRLGASYSPKNTVSDFQTNGGRRLELEERRKDLKSKKKKGGRGAKQKSGTNKELNKMLETSPTILKTKLSANCGIVLKSS